MATSLTRTDHHRQREHILNDFQAITGLNIDDAIQFLDQYQWKLDDIINDYYDGIDLMQKPDDHLSERLNDERIKFFLIESCSSYFEDLGKFYSKGALAEQFDQDSDQHYAKLLQLYNNKDEYAKQGSSRSASATPIYHERQRLLRCGLHSLNNLFQVPNLFTPKHLEAIVREYDKRKFFNDYRTLWLGNYDLRILIEAINRCGFDVRQVDMYRGESLYDLPWDSYFGLLVNLNGDHWFTIKNLNGIYYNLDSSLRKPIEIGQKDCLILYLINLMNKTRAMYLFVVSSK